MTFLKSLSLYSVSVFAVLGCGRGDALSPTADRVIHVDDDDAEMNKAIEMARETFSKFEQNWKRPANENVSVKFAVPTDDGEVEHIWFSPISITEDEITGACANLPERVTGLGLGEMRTLDRSTISDWMIINGGRCYGGYTIRVLAKREPGSAPDLEFADF